MQWVIFKMYSEHVRIYLKNKANMYIDIYFKENHPLGERFIIIIFKLYTLLSVLST